MTCVSASGLLRRNGLTLAVASIMRIAGRFSRSGSWICPPALRRWRLWTSNKLCDMGQGDQRRLFQVLVMLSCSNVTAECSPESQPPCVVVFVVPFLISCWICNARFRMPVGSFEPRPLLVRSLSRRQALASWTLLTPAPTIEASAFSFSISFVCRSLPTIGDFL